MNKVEGLIAFHGLQEWWFSSFTDQERTYIDNLYQPMGAPAHTLTQGKTSGQRGPTPEFLNGLNTWFRSSKDSEIADRIHKKLSQLARENPIVKPGYYEGRHFTTYVRDFENLKRAGDFVELEKLLIELVKATETDGVANNWGVAPAYYSELAILYRKQKEYAKEVYILERFEKQKHGNGVMPAKLSERLVKAKELLAKQSDI